MGERDAIIQKLEECQTNLRNMAVALKMIYGDANTAAKAILMCVDEVHDVAHDIDEILSGGD